LMAVASGVCAVRCEVGLFSGMTSPVLVYFV
jgi:hypothetical protein